MPLDAVLVECCLSCKTVWDGQTILPYKLCDLAENHAIRPSFLGQIVVISRRVLRANACGTTSEEH